jgi:hypothetical protein
MSLKPPTAAPVVAKAAVEASSKWIKCNGNTVEVGPGCYLIHEELGAGSLIINWSQVPIDDAVAYFKPGRGAKVGNFMYTANGGRSELQRDVNGDSSNHTRFQNYCRGYSRFFQQAKEKFACVTVLSCNAAIWLNKGDVNAEYKLGMPIDFDEDKGWTSNDAIGKYSHCSFDQCLLFSLLTPPLSTHPSFPHPSQLLYPQITPDICPATWSVRPSSSRHSVIRERQ